MTPIPSHAVSESPEIGRSFSRRQAAVFFAVLLVGGLVLVAPILAWLVWTLRIPLPRPLLLAVVVVGGLYVVLIALMEEIELGSLVALIVTSTFVANVPLTGFAPTYPGNLGPQLFLFELPLLVLLGFQLHRREYSRDSFTWIEYALFAFIYWTVLSALLGTPPHRDTAIYFTLSLVVITLGFGATLRSVRRGVLGFRSVLWVFLIAVYGHLLFSLFQFINQAPFGFTVLGEIDRYPSTVIDIGILGTYDIGVYLSGFTGGNSPLSVLLVFSVPIALVLWSERPVKQRMVGYLSVILMIVMIRLTDKDAARAALVLSLLFIGLYWFWRRRKQSGRTSWISTLIGWVRSSETKPSRAAYSLLLIGAVGAVLYPTMGVGSEYTLLSIPVPTFDLTSLDIRLRQYIASVTIAGEYPIFGLGGANYPYVAPEYGLPAKLAGQWFPLHNMYLAPLAETGIPGFLLFMATIGLVLREGLRRVLAERADDLLAVGMFAGILGYTALMFWEVNVRFSMLIPFWLLMGALVADNEFHSEISIGS